MQVAALSGLADLAAPAESASHLLRSGRVLQLLVAVLSAAGAWAAPRPTVEAVRHATRAMANLACCRRAVCHKRCLSPSEGLYVLI